jgi:hypothetical protein
MIAHRAGEADLVQDGATYLHCFAIPNLWFHLGMAYAILRTEGLSIGKADFDGWHRYCATQEAGVEADCVPYDGDDPQAFVLGANMHRRHLTASQRAAAVVAVSEWKPEGRPAVGVNSAPGAELLAARASVSTRTIEQVKTAVRAGLGDAVRDGKVSAKAAAESVRPKKPAPVAPSLGIGGDEEEAPADDDAATRFDDLAADLESLHRIVEADDKLSAAWAEVTVAKAQLTQMTAMYEAKCEELSIMTKEAKRWMRRAEKAEKAVVK